MPKESRSGLPAEALAKEGDLSHRKKELQWKLKKRLNKTSESPWIS